MVNLTCRTCDLAGLARQIGKFPSQNGNSPPSTLLSHTMKMAELISPELCIPHLCLAFLLVALRVWW